MANLLLEIKIAIRYIFNRTEENFISLISIFSFLGISLGVATLIIVMSVMNGFREKLIDNIIGAGGHISIISQTNQIDDYEKIISKLQSENLEIVKIDGLIQSQVLANTESNNIGLIAFGVDDIKKKDILFKNILEVKDEFAETFQKSKKIIIGRRLSEILNLNVGSYLNLVSSKSFSSVLGEIPRMKEYEIGAIFETGIADFDSNVIFFPLKESQIFFQIYDSINKIEIDLKSPYQSKIISQKIQKQFVDEGKNDLILNDWQSTNSHYLSALKTEKNVMMLILSLIILVAIFNVISSLVMLVTEKQKSIAILKSFGMTKSSIMRIFLYCGMMISVVSTILGSIIGVIFSININSIKAFLENIFNISLFDSDVYIFNEMPSSIHSADIICIVGFSLCVSFIAIIWPSKKAAEKDPAVILRYL